MATALGKSPQYGYYADPDTKEVVYGDYDTAMHHAPYETKNPRRDTPSGPAGPRVPGSSEPGNDPNAPEAPDPNRDFDPSFGGAIGSDSPGRGAGAPGGGDAGPGDGTGPGGGPGLKQRRRGSVLKNDVERFPYQRSMPGQSLLMRNDR